MAEYVYPDTVYYRKPRRAPYSLDRACYPSKKYLKKHLIVAAHTVTIMPCSSNNRKSLFHTLRSIKTHKETCDSVLVCFDNSSPKLENRRRLKDYVESLGYIYKYCNWPFSLSAIYNLGTLLTNSKFIVHSAADVTYTPGWLDEIREMWEIHGRKYNSYHPVAAPKGGLEGPQWTRLKTPRKVVPVSDPIAHVQVFYRPDVYHWDEALPWWESDCDYWLWMSYHKKTGALCMGARVDTYVRGIIESVDPESVPRGHLDSSVAWHHIRRKWGAFMPLGEKEFERTYCAQPWDTEE